MTYATGVLSRDRSGAADEEAPFELAWISRTLGGAERRQVVVLAVSFPLPPDASEQDAAAAVISRHQRVSSIAGPLGGEIVRASSAHHLVAWGHRSTCVDDARLAAAAAFELAGEHARCGLDAGIATIIDPTYSIPGVPFVSDAIPSAVGRLARAGAGEVVAGREICAQLGGRISAQKIDADGAFLAITMRPRMDRAGALEKQRSADLGCRAMRDLRHLWQAVHVGQSGFAVLSGDAWSGKSTLARQLACEVVASNGRLILIECRPENKQRALVPLRDAVALLEEVSAQNPAPADAIRALDTALDRVLDYEVLAGAEVSRIAQMTAAAFAAAALDRPVAIVIEDVDWADPSTLACLRALPGLSHAGERVLVVVTGRASIELTEAARTERGWQHFVVQARAAAMIEGALGEDPECSALHRRAIARVAANAAGNVGLALELGRVALAVGGPDAHYRILAKPNRLNPLLSARLDALGVLKPLVQAAALLGHAFDGRVLAILLQIRPQSVFRHLDALVDRGVLTRRQGCAHEYRFNEILMWSQAYGSVIRPRRRELHAQIARMLEGEAGASLVVAPEVIGYHWKKAGEPQCAFAWWSKAAHAEAERGAPDVVVSYVNEALAAMKQAPEACSVDGEAALMSLLGSQLQALQGSSSISTVAAYERARDIVAALPPRQRDLDLDISWGMTTMHLVRGDVRAALDASETLLAEARRRNLDEFVVVALTLHGTALLMSGDVTGALAHFEGAVDAAGRHRSRSAVGRFVSEPGAVALAHLASAQALAGRTRDSKASRAQALARIGKIAHPHTTSNVLGVLALAAMHLEDTGAAAALGKASLAVSAVHGYRYWEARARLIIAYEETRTLGNSDPFELVRQVDGQREVGAARARVFSTCLAADAVLRSGFAREALGLLEGASLQVSAQGERLYLPEVMRLETQARFELGLIGREEAIASLAEAEQVATSFGAVAFARRSASMREHISGEGKRGAKPLKRARSPVARRTP